MIYRARNGFTLVEVAVVIVVVGFIMGAVMVGREMLQAGRVQATVAQKTRLDQAFNDFRDRFHCLPGDCLRDSDGKMPGNITTAHDGYTTNGFDDGVIWYGTPNISNFNADRHKYLWRQLRNTGMINDRFDGETVPGAAFYGSGPTTPGYHSPGCPICDPRQYTSAGTTVNSGGWAVLDGNALRYLACGANATWTYDGEIPSEPVYWLRGMNGGVINAENGYAFDTKLDDGKPLTGAVIAVYNYYYSDAACSGSNVYIALRDPPCVSLSNNRYSVTTYTYGCFDMLIRTGW